MTHTIQDIRDEYRRLDRIMGIDSTDVEIQISNRAGKQLGCFRAPNPRALRPSSDPLCIRISASVLDDDEAFFDTIRHEYAHMAVFKLYPGEQHQHDGVWKDICRRIGCVPKSKSAMPEEREREWQNSAKYWIHCTRCGTDSYYHRAGKCVQYMLMGRGSRLRCGKCGGSKLELYVRESPKGNRMAD